MLIYQRVIYHHFLHVFWRQGREIPELTSFTTSHGKEVYEVKIIEKDPEFQSSSSLFDLQQINRT